MDNLGHLLDGFRVALTPTNLLWCLIGCFWGTVVGVLPGLGPLAGMALLLPFTFSLPPETAIIMLAGIFYGAMYGGSTTSILVRIPGEAASVVTCLDGYEMARRGRAGPALMIAAVGSFIGGSLSVLGLIFFAPPLARAMLAVGPAAEFVLMSAALLVIAFIGSGSAVKTLAMVLLGLALATVGLDQLTAYPRFTFGSLALTEGLGFVPIAIGLFGVSEILLNLEEKRLEAPKPPRLRDLLPRRADLQEAAPAIARGSVVGFVFGIVPGISHIVSTFVSYALEKRLSKRPEEFGKGAIAGVAGPETANNATTGSSMIPLLVLGIPAIPATAILLSAMLVHGVQPGPQLISDHPQVFWGLIASMYLGNLILLLLNLPFVGLFTSLLRIPSGILSPLVLLISIIGVYAVDASALDLMLMAGAGAIGYVLRKFSFDVAPLLLALVLGDRLETSFRRALTVSDGDYTVFVTGPAAQGLLTAIALVAALLVAARAFGWRKGLSGT
ncbi:MAG TPA: tripartite tricarboxylate transporter permease [Azospirillaceae bacterium]|nr:tripartite tricarboxylate transporter permease [Azospirillaceae bacterium]